MKLVLETLLKGFQVFFPPIIRYSLQACNITSDRQNNLFYCLTRGKRNVDIFVRLFVDEKNPHHTRFCRFFSKILEKNKLLFQKIIRTCLNDTFGVDF